MTDKAMSNQIAIEDEIGRLQIAVYEQWKEAFQLEADPVVNMLKLFTLYREEFARYLHECQTEEEQIGRLPETTRLISSGWDALDAFSAQADVWIETSRLNNIELMKEQVKAQEQARKALDCLRLFKVWQAEHEQVEDDLLEDLRKIEGELLPLSRLTSELVNAGIDTATPVRLIELIKGVIGRLDKIAQSTYEDVFDLFKPQLKAAKAKHRSRTIRGGQERKAYLSKLAKQAHLEFDNTGRWKGNSAYEQWLCEPEWQEFRIRKLEQAGYKCEGCKTGGSQVILDLHHETYERLTREWDSDVQVLCRACCRGKHGGGE